MYPQHVSGATVESHDEDYPQWLMTLKDDEINNLRLQGHSHVNMGVTPSGVDEVYYETLLSQVKDYYIIMVINKNYSMTLRLYDIENNLMFEDIPLYKIVEKNAAKDWYKQQAAEYIKEKKPVVVYGNGYGYGYGSDYYRREAYGFKPEKETKKIKSTTLSKYTEVLDELAIVTKKGGKH